MVSWFLRRRQLGTRFIVWSAPCRKLFRHSTLAWLGLSQTGLSITRQECRWGTPSQATQKWKILMCTREWYTQCSCLTHWFFDVFFLGRLLDSWPFEFAANDTRRGGSSARGTSLDFRKCLLALPLFVDKCKINRYHNWWKLCSQHQLGNVGKECSPHCKDVRSPSCGIRQSDNKKQAQHLITSFDTGKIVSGLPLCGNSKVVWKWHVLLLRGRGGTAWHHGSSRPYFSICRCHEVCRSKTLNYVICNTASGSEHSLEYWMSARTCR